MNSARNTTTSTTLLAQRRAAVLVDRYIRELAASSAATR
jgi:hypothetical protein